MITQQLQNTTVKYYTNIKYLNCKKKFTTSKQSSRMHTAHLCWPYMLQWPLVDVTPRGSSNEQVWTGDYHQMPLVATGSMGSQVWWGGGGLYSEVQCIMGNSYMGIPPIDGMMVRHNWKDYIPTTSLAGRNNGLCVSDEKNTGVETQLTQNLTFTRRWEDCCGSLKSAKSCWI